MRARAVAVRNKRARLQPTGRLKELGLALMAEAEAATTRPSLRRAVLYRDGLMIALLAHRPVRLQSFTMTLIGENLVRIGQTYCLRYGGKGTKNRQSFEAEIPGSLVPALERYLTHHRRILLTRAGRQPAAALDALWISEVATGMTAVSVHNRIRKHTGKAFGRIVPPHWFRDCAVTTIAIEDPVNARMTKSILGDRTLAIAEKHYNQAQSLEASRRHQAMLGDLRRKLANIDT